MYVKSELTMPAYSAEVAHAGNASDTLLLIQCSSQVSAEQRAALAAADVVCVETGVGADIVAVAPRGALVESVPSLGSLNSTHQRALARARQLAADGWRVVWLSRSEVDPVGAAFVSGDTAAAALAAAPAPPALATALNGLAG
jgi:hypothetical protein